MIFQKFLLSGEIIRPHRSPVSAPFNPIAATHENHPPPADRHSAFRRPGPGRSAPGEARSADDGAAAAPCGRIVPVRRARNDGPAPRSRGHATFLVSAAEFKRRQPDADGASP